MSILTQLLKKQITFTQAATEIENWAQSLVSKDANLTAATGVLVTDLKQAASNAVDLADHEFATYVQPAADAVAVALESALASASKGATLPFNPFVTHGIDTIASAVKAEVDAWAMQAKSALTSNH
jgi:hypothetical protein